MSRDVTYADQQRADQMLLKDPTAVPAVFERKAVGEFKRAGHLAEATEQLFHSLHTPKGLLPGNLTDAQFAQRQAILELAHKIIESERDRAMDDAVTFWIEYKKRS